LRRRRFLPPEAISLTNGEHTAPLEDHQLLSRRLLRRAKVAFLAATIHYNNALRG
jgi:hypothetical protein